MQNIRLVQMLTLFSLLFSGAVYSADLSVDAADGSKPANYANEDSWLCLPGRVGDACDVDLSATIVQADGKTRLEHFVAANDPAFDCFYVYPTVSMDQSENSDMLANDEERRVIESQFARFKSVCKTYAPMYRQVTLKALRSRIEKGLTSAGNGQLAYRDVEAAFDYYLKHFNQGRPFVLVGHSQGSRMLTILLQQRFDRNPELKKQLISALLIGAPVQMDIDGDKGSSFASIPPCSAAEQSGCVVAYASFRSDAPPPENSLFGKPNQQGVPALCVNPAAPGSDRKVVLDAYLGAGGAGQASLPPEPWAKGVEIDTPFVNVPGLLSAACQKDEHGSYLAVQVNGNPNDSRVDDIVGDVVVAGQRRQEWGLHLIDVSIAQGDLIGLVQKQAEAWAR
ncbi:DUF3089 domain-containing protein [Aestuariicella sp. G3-2]|uniref:DUF3089 domain-containing protein n=1 Tax=Pseudomaricurvus albidus TaxID=2842452 RepID=UPI001C0CA892|nr:DUF3089 domain-containing protein [Aestuariicella albida]MBU3069380.1 DUF3089 domain-containing protein [Aestuariicella albida]